MIGVMTGGMIEDTIRRAAWAELVLWDVDFTILATWLMVLEWIWYEFYG